MNAAEFRRLALEQPEAEEKSHMDHPDFRIRGKIFATLGPDEEWGMVKLTPDQQAELMLSAPAVFEPAAGAWGRGGATIIRLGKAKVSAVREALDLAWRNTAPKRLLRDLDAD